MYRQPARYLVAGEIVRTSRTYARSVSPLSRQEVQSVSPDLLADLIAVSPDGRGRSRDRGGGRGRGPVPDAGARRAGRASGEAAQVHLLGQTFAVAEHGKRRLVTLPWAQAAPIARRAGRGALAGHRALRGRIVLDGAEIMSGARLGALFEVLEKIDPAHRVNGNWPRDTLHLPQDAGPLLERLQYVLALSPRKAGGTKLSFLALQTESGGAFWLSARRNLQNAVADSLAALEALADAPEQALDDAQQARLSAVYRRVSNLL